MSAKRFRSYALTGLIVLGIATTARAQLTTIPIITSTEINTDTLTLLIHGTNFIATPLPRVLLGTDIGGFEELVVTHATTGSIDAQLTSITPGSYRLVVQFGSRGVPIASLDVTMGAAGPRGPQGVPGDQGPQGPPGPDNAGRIGELEARIDALSLRLAALEDLLQHFSRSGDDVIIEGANLHVRSGSGSTDGPVNGLGNLVLGYNELRGEGDDRSGSHNLVVGSKNNYSAYGGLVAGFQNAVSSAFSASISGTDLNFVATGAAKLKAGTDVELQSGANTILKAGGNLNAITGLAADINAGTAAKLRGITIDITGTTITDIKGALVKIN